MRRVVTDHNKVATLPEGAFVEVVREAGSSKESKTQYLPASEVGAAPVGSINPVVPTSPIDEISGSGILVDMNMDSLLTTIDMTAAGSITIPVGTTTGQLKTLRMVGDLGDCTVAPAGDQIASFILNDVGDQVELMWDGGGWIALDNVNIISGQTAVVISMV